MKLANIWSPRRRAALLPLLLWVPFSLACSSSPPAVEGTADQASAAQAADQECKHYAQRLCTELGPRSDACRSVMGVVPLLAPTACQAGMRDFAQTERRIADLRGDCQTLVQEVCDAVGEDSEGCRAIRQDLPQIPPGHCAALKDDKERLVAALREREAMSGPVSEDQWAALIASGAPSFGAADAKVVLVEFSDFECPFCAQAAVTVNRLKQAYGDRVRFVFRQFPLPFHPHAHGAAQAALAAHDQGRFWDYHDLLFDNQDALGKDALHAYAQKLGLDMDAFGTAATGASTAERIAEDMELGQAVQIRGTPTLFVDRARVDNPIDYEQVAAAVDAALATHASPSPAPSD